MKFLLIITFASGVALASPSAIESMYSTVKSALKNKGGEAYWKEVDRWLDAVANRLAVLDAMKGRERNANQKMNQEVSSYLQSLTDLKKQILENKLDPEEAVETLKERLWDVPASLDLDQGKNPLRAPFSDAMKALELAESTFRDGDTNPPRPEPTRPKH